MVLGRLQKEGLKAKMEKCAFFQQQVSYLGHVILSQGVSTDPKKVETVANWPRPSHISELRSFLGFASYYQRFVEGFAKLAKPLHQLVADLAGTKSKKGSGQALEVAWTSQCEEGFRTLKAKLVSAPVLAYADFSRPFIVEIDASHDGLGAVLSQQTDSSVRPVAYASRGLRPTERNMSNYSSMKLEFKASPVGHHGKIPGIPPRPQVCCVYRQQPTEPSQDRQTPGCRAQVGYRACSFRF